MKPWAKRAHGGSGMPHPAGRSPEPKGSDAGGDATPRWLPPKAPRGGSVCPKRADRAGWLPEGILSHFLFFFSGFVMVCLLIDENQNVKKFKSIERAEIYMKRHKGVYFLIEYSKKFLGVSVIQSEGGDVIKIKDTTINRYS